MDLVRHARIQNAGHIRIRYGLSRLLLAAADRHIVQSVETAHILKDRQLRQNERKLRAPAIAPAADHRFHQFGIMRRHVAVFLALIPQEASHRVRDHGLEHRMVQSVRTERGKRRILCFHKMLPHLLGELEMHRLGQRMSHKHVHPSTRFRRALHGPIRLKASQLLLQIDAVRAMDQVRELRQNTGQILFSEPAAGGRTAPVAADDADRNVTQFFPDLHREIEANG